MATVPAPRTWSTGDKFSAARENLELRDSLNFLLSPPRCQVSQVSTGTTIANGAYVVLLFDTDVYDTDSMHSTVSNTSRVVFNTAGLWLVHCYFGMPSATYTTLAMNLRRNAGGVQANGSSERTWNVDPITQGRECCEIVVGTVGDYVELFVTQTSGASRVTSLGATNVCGITARRVAS